MSSLPFVPRQSPALAEVAAQVGAVADEVRLEGTGLDKFIRKVFQDEAKKLQAKRLTWGRGHDLSVPRDRVKGLLNKRLPYVGPIEGFYVQNTKLLRSNGTVAKLSDVSDEPYRWFDRRGREHTAPSARETLKGVLERHLEMAAKLDPNLCGYCYDFRAEDFDERLRHLFREHPAAFAEKAGIAPAAKEEPVAAPGPTAVISGDEHPGTPRAKRFYCEEHRNDGRRCGKGFKFASHLKNHVRTAKVHRAQGVHGNEDAHPAEETEQAAGA